MSKGKTVVFPFEDGKKEISIGDSVWLMTRGYSTRGNKGYENFIIGIGRKYISLGWYKDSIRENAKFDIITGNMKTEYFGDSLYSSEEAYKLYTQEREAVAKVIERVKNLGYYSDSITRDQALRI